MYTIHFNFEQAGIHPVKLENISPGQTLLEVALMHDIELHHNCGGVCACTTCHLYVLEGMEYIDEMSRRERDVIATVPHARPESRQGCQSLLVDGSGTIRVLLPDQSRIPYLDFDF